MTEAGTIDGSLVGLRWMIATTSEAPRMPKPDTALPTNAEAAKNRPSERRLVLSCEASTTSAIIEEPMVDDTMPNAVEITEVKKMMTISAREWLGGMSPASLSRSGPRPTATDRATNAMQTGRLPNRRDRMGADGSAMKAEMKTPAVKIEICWAVNSQ